MTDGPFTVVWEGIDVAPDATWERHERTVDHEYQAVSLWQTAKLYENTRPISITPEPDWSRYTYGGQSTVTR